ncbi:hypothetical protein Pla175_11790 [Pirellulimonas nuda]|uniref:Uncharacterized protein n=1 Tax=Pirellulimonas nuda TaxID=2528009 RepID=A0A518D8K8_9BACT|nr:hypothetical protein [Pirellulimonas nuda]QDU87812.1 hypothetical protein Pla175_11790 [Pirellulimonas nuda]
MIRSAAAWLGILLCAASAYGSGFYNMPSQGQQCLGMGFGPGYHAPMLLVRPWKPTSVGQGITWVRAPLRPQAPAYEVAIHPQAGGAHWGPSNVGDGFGAPSVLAAPPQPAYAAPPAPRNAPPTSEAVPRPPAAPQANPAAEPASPSDKLRPDPVNLPSAWRKTQTAVR